MVGNRIEVNKVKYIVLDKIIYGEYFENQIGNGAYIPITKYFCITANLECKPKLIDPRDITKIW